jgi:hypothetical protein
VTLVVDVVSEIVIARPRLDVAAFASDPLNAPRWYVNIREARWESAPSLGIGARVSFVARFLGRDLAYTYDIIKHVAGERLVMRTSSGPFPMETTYAWAALDPARTRMTLRNRGVPAGFSRLVAPFMAAAMRRENRKDLARLKSLLESR